jgi:hypothetical protein
MVATSRGDVEMIFNETTILLSILDVLPRSLPITSGNVDGWLE